MKVILLKTDDTAAIEAIRQKYFPAGVTQLVYDDSTTPITNQITPYATNMAAHLDNIDPIKHYPPTNK